MEKYNGKWVSKRMETLAKILANAADLRKDSGYEYEVRTLRAEEKFIGACAELEAEMLAAYNAVPSARSSPDACTACGGNHGRNDVGICMAIQFDAK